MLEIRTEYEIRDRGEVCGWVIRKDDPTHYWVSRDFGEAEWIVMKRVIDLGEAVRFGLVRRIVKNGLPTSTISGAV